MSARAGGRSRKGGGDPLSRAGSAASVKFVGGANRPFSSRSRAAISDGSDEEDGTEVDPDLQAITRDLDAAKKAASGSAAPLNGTKQWPPPPTVNSKYSLVSVGPSTTSIASTKVRRGVCLRPR